ncbi:hypothetical protein VB774_01995 [Pseudanabaena galeata UHCC 0370]|uniref:Uncharacterized protein n=1 Tax=Pseudanabaena galeata UHCC 0370 TaxID=3110310 RepID=A0ABU5TDM9_9CYAN|nr:hypothetical protein [Pseudanabaena galeata]MEA5476380.1 hypothetical protein [Pseudanabaena galeata UHCC 0370]
MFDSFKNKMNDNWQNMQAFYSQAVKHIKSSAVAPANWLAASGGAIGCFGMLICLSLNAPSFAVFWCAIVVICIIPAIFLNIYFAFKDPDRLQSEQYLHQKGVLDLFRDKGKNFDAKYLQFAQLMDSESPVPKKASESSQKLRSPSNRKKLSPSEPVGFDDTVNVDSDEIEGDDNDKD